MSNSSPSQLLVIGSINTDMVVKTATLPLPGQTVLGGDFIMTAGGKGANQAVAAARLGADIKLVGTVGEDQFGNDAIARLESEKVDCRHVEQTAGHASGVALVSVDGAGENHIVVAPGANNTITREQVETAMSACAADSIVLLQLEIPLDIVQHATAVATSRGLRVILDPAPATALPDELFTELFLITPNETEANILTGIEVNDEDSAAAAAENLLHRGVKNVAITLGSKGVYLANGTMKALVPTPEVSVMDTTAAGDCFNGALAVALSRGTSLVDATAIACQAASICVTRMGAQDAMPKENEVTL